jgi:hypothetical protein
MLLRCKSVVHIPLIHINLLAIIHYYVKEYTVNQLFGSLVLKSSIPVFDRNLSAEPELHYLLLFHFPSFHVRTTIFKSPFNFRVYYPY